MQCGAVKCIAVWCSSVQCSAVQCTGLHCTALLSQVHRLESTTFPEKVQCSAVQCTAVQYFARRGTRPTEITLSRKTCSAMQCSVLRSSTLQCRAVRFFPKQNQKTAIVEAAVCVCQRAGRCPASGLRLPSCHTPQPVAPTPLSGRVETQPFYKSSRNPVKLPV